MTISPSTSNSSNSNNTNTDGINSIHHLLYFHQNDHPGLILILKKLTGSENYSTWKRSMMIALNARNKLKLVNGEYEEPVVNSPLRSLWEKANDMKLKGLWDELDALEAPYACVCPCDCTNGRNNGERDQRKRLMQFLMGLDENYTNVRSRILLIQPLPLVSKAYSMLRQEEMQRDIPKPTLTIPTTLNTTSNYRPPHANKTNQPNQTVRRTPFRKGVYCTNYRKEGHDREECYKIVGYPPGHPFHNKYVPPS
ncbi:cysteine-rich receptor-like protein kinase 8 [Tanacetum coccineum]